MILPYFSAVSPRRRLAVLALAASLLLGLGACASSTGGGSEASADSGRRGVIIDTADMTNRRIRLKVSLPGFSEVVNLREGQSVRFDQPDGSYILIPGISKTEVGKVEVHVRREALGQTEEASATFSVREPYEFSHEVNVDWPFLTLEVLDVQPRLRPGL